MKNIKRLKIFRQRFPFTLCALHCLSHSASLSLLHSSAYDELCVFVFIHFSRDLTFYYVCALKLEGEKNFFSLPPSPFCRVLPLLAWFVCELCNKWSFKPRDIRKTFEAVVKIPWCKISFGKTSLAPNPHQSPRGGECEFIVLENLMPHSGAIFPSFTHDKLKTFFSFTFSVLTAENFYGKDVRCLIFTKIPFPFCRLLWL